LPFEEINRINNRLNFSRTIDLIQIKNYIFVGFDILLDSIKLIKMDFLQLIQKVQAQGADTLAAPTFPFTPPGGSTVPPPSTDEGRNLLLQTDSTSVKTQQRFKVRIYVDSDESEITGFTVNITFDPDYFQVIDADTGTTGVQIDYLDSTFDTTVNTVNNDSGIINLRTEVEESQASSIARTVAEIELIAIKTGTSQIKITQSSSNILSTSGVDVLDNVNSLNFNITAQTTQEEPDDSDGTPIIPKTGITDQFDLLVALVGGVLLILTGIYIRKISKREAAQAARRKN